MSRRKLPVGAKLSKREYVCLTQEMSDKLNQFAWDKGMTVSQVLGKLVKVLFEEEK